jgi:hypothetical protein
VHQTGFSEFVNLHPFLPHPSPLFYPLTTPTHRVNRMVRVVRKKREKRKWEEAMIWLVIITCTVSIHAVCAYVGVF